LGSSAAHEECAAQIHVDNALPTVRILTTNWLNFLRNPCIVDEDVDISRFDHASDYAVGCGGVADIARRGERSTSNAPGGLERSRWIEVVYSDSGAGRGKRCSDAEADPTGGACDKRCPTRQVY
jgi:hypothetical protein